ncbi:MAG: DNA-processing protein DprA [Planctomycetota bacterium]
MSDIDHLQHVIQMHDECSQEEPTSLPDIADEDRHAYLQLTLVPGIGPRIMSRLLAHFGTASAVLGATLKQLGEVERVGPKLAISIRDSCTNGLVEKVLDHCLEHEIDLLYPNDGRYPHLLREIATPPLLLYAKGSFSKSDDFAIAMVGTRHATHYGRVMAERLARGLSSLGATIVSGLARGIDAVCHETAMNSGGRTIAVLGSSISDIYPPEHRKLAERIVEQGLLLSETHPFAQPKAGVFPQRNRIISGISLAVVVVEAADRSGSLITASHAREQGRDVMAVPGPAPSRTSRGCNQLIRDGAVLIQDAQDVVEQLGPVAKSFPSSSGLEVKTPAELQLNDVEQSVLGAIESLPTDIDAVIARSGLPVPRVLSTLSVLELRGFIVRSGGRSVARRH